MLLYNHIIIYAMISCMTLCHISAFSQGNADVIKEYTSCCGAQPVDFTIDDKHALYIPNSFTPGGDDKDNVFIPSFTKNIKTVQSMFIYSLVGDTLLYTLYGFDADRFDKKNFGWDGTRTGGEPRYDGDFKIHKGGFRYEITVFSESKGFLVFKGIGCALHCGTEASKFKDNINCFYPTQVDVKGKSDKNKKVKAKDCFK
ncbi:MAG: hypothetical protein WAT22_04490 [Saprospiraceae bacterium]|nr:hypothetical protein [Saprospiraceae bacterium]